MPVTAVRQGKTLIIGGGFIALECADSFEWFLGLIGGVCATPIAFVYPALFHLLLCEQSRARQGVDVLIVAFGSAAVVFVVSPSA